MKVAIVLTIKALKLGEDKLALNRDIVVIEAPTDEKENLDFFYKHIDCNIMDGVYFDGFDVFCDDEGLFRTDNVVCEYNGAELAGNLVITAGCDSIGKTLWFDDVRDAKKILEIKAMLENAPFIGLVI